MYNSQANNETNNRLTDDVELVVWDMNTFLDETNITSPMMKMDKNGNWYMSYGYKTNDMYVNLNGTTRSVDYSFNKFHNTNVAFDDNGGIYAVAMNTDRVNDTSSRFVLYVPRDGMPASAGGHIKNSTNVASYNYSYSTDSKKHLELAYNDSTKIYDINRVKMPKIVTYTPENTTDTYVAMVYYDYNNDINPLKFRFGKKTKGQYSVNVNKNIKFTYSNRLINEDYTAYISGWTIDDNTDYTGKYVVIDNTVYELTRKTRYGGVYYTLDYDPKEFTSKIYTCTKGSIDGGVAGSIPNYQEATITQSNDPNTTDSSYRDYHIVASNSSDIQSGQYAAVGIVPNGDSYVGVVAWYDANTSKICYSYNENPETPVSGGEWQQSTHAKYIDTARYSGWYIDLAVDDAGHIHIAYYNSAKGDLKYVYLESYDATPSAPVTVDSYLSVGTNITINVRQQGSDYVPYIYYYNSSSNQTSNSIKVAWRKDMTSLRNGAYGDKFTGAWECMTIPSINIPVEATVCGGVPTGTHTGTNVIDYSKTVVLGYMTDKYYEKAYIKGDITSTNW